MESLFVQGDAFAGAILPMVDEGSDVMQAII
jgi:hypothetical protein